MEQRNYDLLALQVKTLTMELILADFTVRMSIINNRLTGTIHFPKISQQLQVGVKISA